MENSANASPDASETLRRRLRSQRTLRPGFRIFRFNFIIFSYSEPALRFLAISSENKVGVPYGASSMRKCLKCGWNVSEYFPVRPARLNCSPSGVFRAAPPSAPVAPTLGWLRTRKRAPEKIDSSGYRLLRTSSYPSPALFSFAFCFHLLPLSVYIYTIYSI